MKVNMDGLRAEITEIMNRLGVAIEEIIDNTDAALDYGSDLTSAFDDAADRINDLNSLYDPDNKSFTDLTGKVSVRKLDQDDA